MEVGTSVVTEGDLVPMGYMNDLVLGKYMYLIKQEFISLLRLFVIIVICHLLDPETDGWSDTCGSW